MKTIKTCSPCNGVGRVPCNDGTPHNRVCGVCHGKGRIRTESILSGLRSQLPNRGAGIGFAGLMIFLGGCLPQNIHTPLTPVTPTAELKITIDGEGRINVGGGAEITAKSAEPKSSLCPCCGATGVCQGLCGKVGCVCSRGQTSAASTVGNVVALPQSGTRYEQRQVCENGICRTVTVPVQVPLAKGGQTPTASVPKRAASPSTHGGRITVYVGGSPACVAMQRDLADRDDIDFVAGTPPEINGNRWHPTAVKPDGSRWSPARAGWDTHSVRLFDEWRRGG